MPNYSLALAVEIDGDGAHPAAWRRADGPLPQEDPVIVENIGEFGARRINDPRAVVARWREQVNISPYPIPDGLDDIVGLLVPEHLGLRAPSARRQRVSA